MNTYRKAGITYGILFILSFLSYGIGSSIVDALTKDPQNLANVGSSQGSMMIGFVLMALVHSVVTVASAIVLLPILKKFNQTFSYFYLSGAIMENVLLTVGGIAVFLILPLSIQFTEMGASASSYFVSLAQLFYNGNFFAYQVGMAIWGIGGLALTYILIQSRLVPRFLAIWGFIGYVFHATGAVLELFGLPYSTYFIIPGGLFEITFSLWLIIKGFNQSALEEILD
jgi:hypothetical protein